MFSLLCDCANRHVSVGVCATFLARSSQLNIYVRINNISTKVISFLRKDVRQPRLVSVTYAKMATTGEQFSLRWNNFHSNLTSAFHDLLQAADMVDVTLAVDGHFLQAHKLVLSICSPYFKQLFKINPCKHPIVILKDITHGNMKDILEFMYLGEVNVLRENLSSFLRTAELLQVKGLTGDDSVSRPTYAFLSCTKTIIDGSILSQNDESSPRKDDKSDSLGEAEDDRDFNQLLDPDGGTLIDYPQLSPPTQQAIFSNMKSHTKNSVSNMKRIKVESTGGPPMLSDGHVEVRNNMCAAADNDENADYIEVPATKLSQSFGKDGVVVKKEDFTYDGLGQNMGAVDVNTQDHGKLVLMFAQLLFRLLCHFV